MQSPRRRKTQWIVLGAVASIAVAATAIAVPSLGGDDSTDEKAKKSTVRTTAQQVGITRAYTNARTNLALTAGGVGPSGKGEVFVKAAGAVRSAEQVWDFTNNKVISEGASRGSTKRCLETDRQDNLFVGPCTANKAAQKWAEKVAVKGQGAFQSQNLLQNFLTKKCVTIGSSTGRGTAEAAARSCNTKSGSQRFILSPAAVGTPVTLPTR
jgi:hypothetical protein